MLQRNHSLHVFSKPKWINNFVLLCEVIKIDWLFTKILLHKTKPAFSFLAAMQYIFCFCLLVLPVLLSQCSSNVSPILCSITRNMMYTLAILLDMPFYNF